MRIKGKLFLSLGVLIVLLGALFYGSFLFFFRTNLAHTKKEIRTLFIDQSKQERSKEINYFKERVQTEKENLDALYYYFLSLPENFLNKNVWQTLATFLAANPDIGFIQLRDLKNDKVFSLNPDLTAVQPVTAFAMNENFLFVLLPLKEKDQGEENLYLAMATPKDVNNILPTYLLFSWKEFGAEFKGFFSEKNFQTNLFLELPKTDENGVEKTHLIKALAPFYEEGIEVIPGKGKKIPSGIAFLTSDGKGKALLSNTLFYEQSFFDDSLNRSPHFDTLKIIVPDKKEIFLGNTFSYETYLVTIGFSLDHLLKELALVSNRLAIVKSDSISIGFSKDGQKLTESQINQTFESIKNQNEIFYSKEKLFSDNDLTLYLVTDFEEATGVLNSFNALGNTLSKKVALQTILVLIGLIALALFILDRISAKITRPLIDLVKATNTIREGKYKEVKFPEVKSKDEIGQLVVAFKEMVGELQEKEKIRTLLNKVVSKDVAEEILKSDVHLGGEDRIATVLFADIRNFTEITQNMPPQKIVKMLNEAMTMISRVIEGEGGIIDKYVGDEVMALYGTPIHNPDHGLRALASAKLMVESLKKWNVERQKAGEMAIELGIGINTGIVVAGNMGAEDRLNYTVIGPSVNLASRLCKAALPMQIIISEFTLEEPGVKESFFVEALPNVTLKGFKDPVKIFQVTGFKWET